MELLEKMIINQNLRLEKNVSKQCHLLVSKFQSKRKKAARNLYTIIKDEILNVHVIMQTINQFF